MSGGFPPASVECVVPKLTRRLVSAGVSQLHGNVISHSVSEEVGKVHLCLREHSVDDRLWDPALRTTKTKPASERTSCSNTSFTFQFVDNNGLYL